MKTLEKIPRKPILSICGRVLCQTVTDILCILIAVCAVVTFVSYAWVILKRWTL